jgi:glycerophosphoryl diester phosphodiesterase
MQIEIKGPEGEAPKLTGDILRRFKPVWDTMEIISFDPALLWAFQESCPGMKTGLLTPRSVNRIQPNVVAYHALHRTRLARAQAIHLHSSQLSKEVVQSLRWKEIDVHAWDVNDETTTEQCMELDVSSICTDNFSQIARCIRRTDSGEGAQVEGSVAG